MTAMRITKRIVDPITFHEFVGIEFIPRLEDTVLDDQLGQSMCFAAPTKPNIHPPPPPPPPPSSPPPESKYRPPTPPKARKAGDDDPNRPRTSEFSPDGGAGGRRNSLLSPGGGRRNSLTRSPGSLRNSLVSPGSGGSRRSLTSPGAGGGGSRRSLTSPGTSQRKSLTSPILSPGSSKRRLSGMGMVSQLSLKNIVEDDVLEEDDLEGSLSNLSDILETSISKIKVVKEVRFADEVQTTEFSRAHLSMMDDLFYASEDLANFRYEAFMEEAGLDIADFD